MARRGMAWRGVAWRGVAWRGVGGLPRYSGGRVSCLGWAQQIDDVDEQEMTEMLMSKSNIGEKEVSGLVYLDWSKAQSWRRCGRGEPTLIVITLHHGASCTIIYGRPPRVMVSDSAWNCRRGQRRGR